MWIIEKVRIFYRGGDWSDVQNSAVNLYSFTVKMLLKYTLVKGHNTNLMRYLKLINQIELIKLPIVDIKTVPKVKRNND